MYAHTTIEKYSHFFVVKHPTPAITKIIYSLSANYTQFGMIKDPKTHRNRWAPMKTFAVYVDGGAEFRFHINQFKEFNDALQFQYIDKKSYTVLEMELYTPASVDLPIKAGWKLYDQQEEASSFILDGLKAGQNAPLIMMPTGSGKSITAMITTARIGYRFAVVVLAGYVDKWIKDITTTFDIDEKEIGVIDGGKKLSRSTFYPSSDLPTPKAFVISLNTITRWYGLYEERRTNPQLEAYDCLPWMFWEHLGIGTVIFDEVHQHFHAVYRTYSYLHVPVAINLSATLLSKDQTIRKVHGMMFPQTKRFDKIKMKRYITTWACAYQITDFARSRLQTTDYGSNTYSQNAFEMSILRHKTIKAQYVKMILDLVERAYVDRYAKGDKLIIFVGRSMMAHKLVDELRKRWPQFSTRTFLEGDPPENMHEPDIRVTTVISGSTAHDIANLRVAIMTNSIDSPVANLQALGRLREMKHRTEHADVHFYYVYCSTIPKQHEYHLNRHELFSDRTLEQKKLFLGTITP